ncbi:MAG TPA: thiamine diphosphokinase [Candidatus Limnocylindrales bacterium]|nr:thiamine diphosphokinase [Candidatus Limnocylindrales bacterium]
MKVVVVASGELAESDAAWLDDADLVIAADGGAGSLDRLGRAPDVLVGDLDSVDPKLVTRLVAAGTTVERHPIDKEASDTELAVEMALGAGAAAVVLLGAVGGERLDHELANLLLLADPALAGRDVRVVRGATQVRAVSRGEQLVMEGSPGDLVTILPVGGDATEVTTEGLRWPLDGATLELGRSRGLSNEVVDAPASVRVTHGTLLVIETALRGDIA